MLLIYDCDQKEFISIGTEWYARESNLKYESVRIDFKEVVFIRAVKKETTDGSGLHVNFVRKQCIFPEVVSPVKWYMTNIKPWA